MNDTATTPRYIAESFRGRWFVTDTTTSTIITDVATGEDTARAVAADMNALAHLGDSPGDGTYEPKTGTITFPISGTAWYTISGSAISSDPEVYDHSSPEAVGAYEALTNATWRKAGKGESYTVTASRDGALGIWGYCMDVGGAFAGDGDPETRADGRALLKVADRIAREALAAGWGGPRQWIRRG